MGLLRKSRFCGPRSVELIAVRAHDRKFQGALQQRSSGAERAGHGRGFGGALAMAGERVDFADRRTEIHTTSEVFRKVEQELGFREYPFGRCVRSAPSP